MKNKITLITAISFLLFAFLPVQLVFAGTPISKVKKNVVDLWKPIKESQPHVTAVEFKKIFDSGKKFVLIDVRTADEFNAAHIPGAINIQRGLIEWVTPRTIKNTNVPIYTYCRTGARSAFVTDRLTKMGYSNVTNIYDAFKGWVEAGYSVYNRHGEFTLNKGGFEKKEK